MKNVTYIIQKSSTLPKDLENVSESFDQWCDIPLLGTVSAGSPIDIYPTEEQISVPACMVRKECYALRVKGDSMVDEHIHDGDIILVKKQTHADNGQSVVVLINGEQTTLKKFYVEATGIRLQPANSQLEAIFLRHDQVQILGIVQCIVRMP